MFADGVLPPATRSVPSAALGAALTAAVDGLVEIDPQELAPDELGEAMVALRRQQARLAAVTTELTAAFEASGAWADDGSRTPADWIATRCRLPRSTVRADLRLGRQLRTMPHTRAAVRAGDIAITHARRLAKLAANPRTAEHFAGSEAMLVGHAGSMRFDDFEQTCDHWRDAADPDGPERRHGTDHELRRVTLSPGLGGIGHLDGYLTTVGHATVSGALDQIERELFATDWADARAAHGDAATSAHLRRTSRQRRHDALVEMATRAMTAPADGKRPRPLVTIMVGYETFAGRVCQLAQGTVIAPGAIAEVLAGDEALIERVVFDGPNRIADISGARSFRGTLRRVLEVRDRRCTHPTCDAPAQRCQGDHIVAWSHGGLTTQGNGQLQCGFHNRWRHRHPDRDPTPRQQRPADTDP